MLKDYSDDHLQTWRLRLCARMDTLWARFPGQEVEAVHDRWCEAHRAFYHRYCWIEDELIERGCELWPIPQ